MATIQFQIVLLPLAFIVLKCAAGVFLPCVSSEPLLSLITNFLAPWSNADATFAYEISPRQSSGVNATVNIPPPQLPIVAWVAFGVSTNFISNSRIMLSNTGFFLCGTWGWPSIPGRHVSLHAENRGISSSALRK
jgi:hypothetical protein